MSSIASGDLLPGFTHTNLQDFPSFPHEKNDQGRFLRAIAATSAGGKLVIPEGYYYADTISIRKPISLHFQGNATIEATAPNRDILLLQGTRDQENYLLAQPLKRGDRKLFCTTTPNVAPGDLIVLTDDTQRCADRQGDMNTEIHEVVEVNNHHPNLVKNSKMNRDQNGDGICDGFVGSTNLLPPYVFSMDPVVQAQKIHIPSTGAFVYASLMQIIPLQTERLYTLRFETMAKAYKGSSLPVFCSVIWFRKNGRHIGKVDMSDQIYAEWTEKTMLNLLAPKEAAYCQIHLGVTNCKKGYGTLYLRNLCFQQAESCIVIRDFVRLAKQVSQRGCNLYKINPLQNIVINNFKFVMKAGSQRGSGLLLQYVRGALIEEIQGFRFAGSGIQVQKAMYVTIRGFRLEKPQQTGSGQGYGVQFYGGCSGIIVKDGYTYGCRHAVDLDSTYDAYVEHVFDYESQGAAFVMSHNGCCSDITFQNCQTLNSIGSGFVADSQGFAERSQWVFYNFRVIGCTAMIQNHATAAVYWYSPCKQSLVRDCVLRFAGQEKEKPISNAGIRLYPARTEVLITGCDITGFRRGIALQGVDQRQITNDTCRITIRDTRIRLCESAILCDQGLKKRLALYNLSCSQIVKWLFELNGVGSFSELVLDGISLLHSPQCKFINHFRRFHADPERGVIHGLIKNLQSDQPVETLAYDQWQISPNQLYLAHNGNLVDLKGSGGTSSGQPLPDGLLKGQQLILIRSSGNWQILQGENMRFNGGKRSLFINEQRQSLTLIWSGEKWIELD